MVDFQLFNYTKEWIGKAKSGQWAASSKLTNHLEKG